MRKIRDGPDECVADTHYRPKVCSKSVRATTRIGLEYLTNKKNQLPNWYSLTIWAGCECGLFSLTIA